MTDLGLVLVIVCLVVVGQTLLKVGMQRVGVIGMRRLRAPLSLARSVAAQPAVLLGLGLYVVSALGWIAVLSRVDLSYAYPFLGLSYAAVPVVAVMVLHEAFSATKWVAVGLVLLGVVLVASTG